VSPPFLALALILAGPAQAGEPPEDDASEIVNVLLSTVLGFREMTGEELQREVADIGGVAFRRNVPLEFLDRRGLAAYLAEVLDAEYPEERAQADARTLVAFGLLEPGTDLRSLRARLLEQNVAGFYDDRPGKKRLYAVSGERRLTPANQLILSHELRHALQDQYLDVHGMLDDSVGDFDDRRLALLSLLEGDATLLMQQFLLRRLPGGERGAELGGLPLPAPPVEGAPPVLRDQLVLPYTAGLDFIQAVWKRGGWAAVRSAWDHPPVSTEQVLHPSKYLAGEMPRPESVVYAPPRGRVINEGVLGEMLARTLLGDDGEGGGAAGWGGDAFRVWDLSGKTLLVWRAVWDTPAEGSAFARGLRTRLAASPGASERRGSFEIFGTRGFRFALAERLGETALVSSDDPSALDAALAWFGSVP
jgi:hypothetical protein